MNGLLIQDIATSNLSLPDYVNQVEQIGNNTIELKQVGEHNYRVSVTGELKSGKFYSRLDRARNEFAHVCSKVTTFVLGDQHYE